MHPSPVITVAEAAWALGDNYGVAVEQATMLNEFLDAWRAGQKIGNRAELDRRFGTVSWLFEQYWRSPLFLRVSERSRPEYERALRRIEDLPTTNGKVVGDLAVISISPRAVDKIYERLQMGPRHRRPAPRRFRCSSGSRREGPSRQHVARWKSDRSISDFGVSTSMA